MDATTALGAAGTAVKTIDLAIKGWAWYKRWWYGYVSINPPHGFVEPGFVKLHGTHKNTKDGVTPITTRSAIPKLPA